jgi:sortase A
MGTSLPDAAPRTPKTDDHVEGAARPRKARRGMRRLGTVLIVVGCLSLAYGAAVYFWKDPVTDLWAAWKQRGLSSELEQSFAEFEPTPVAAVEAEPASSEAEPATQPADPGAAAEPGVAVEPSAPAAPPDATAGVKAIAADARRFAGSIQEGDAIGRLVIPRLDIDPIFVNGTDWGRDLSQGPGLYPESTLPGAGQVSAIAGHRTTFGAWFRNIDELEGGDPIDLVLPYGTFHYEVVEHEIVDNGDWSILEPRGYRMLVLSACHPLHSASQRWIVYAQLVSVDRPDGTTVTISS